MSNIPSSAMPHAGGHSEISGNDTGSVQAAGTEPYGDRGSQQTGSNAGAGSTGSSGTYQPETYRRESYQPDTYRRTAYTERSRENSGGLMEKAREHKTGIALGVAVGAIAAAAIPFMFGKKKSNAAHYDSDFYIDDRGAARSGSSSAMSGTTTTGTSGTTGASGSTTTLGAGGPTSGRF